MMAERVHRTAAAAGLDPRGLELLSKTMQTAMAPRVAIIEDDHHPEYLHPGRSVLILLDDVGLVDPVALCAACVLDTRRYDLEATDHVVSEQVSPDVAEFRSVVPRSGSETLLEDLLVSEPTVVLVALAERLDQVRHAHQWGDWPAARIAHQEASEIYLKVAERAHARLASRYANWARAFGERYLSDATEA